MERSVLINFIKVHEARDEIPVRYYRKLNIALFCLCAPLGIYANMQVKEVDYFNSCNLPADLLALHFKNCFKIKAEEDLEKESHDGTHIRRARIQSLKLYKFLLVSIFVALVFHSIWLSILYTMWSCSHKENCPFFSSGDGHD